MEKCQYLTCWSDESPRRYTTVSRSRVAHLLRAARSRGDTIHVISSGPNRAPRIWAPGYAIGRLRIIVQQPYHQRLIVASN